MGLWVRHCVFGIIALFAMSVSVSAQVEPSDVPSNEDLARLIDPSLLPEEMDGEMPVIPFDPNNPDTFAGCAGDPVCDAILGDLNLDIGPDMTDIDLILEPAYPDGNPLDEIGEVAGLTDSCEAGTEDTVGTETERFEYRCNSGTNIQSIENKCDLVLIHEISSDYVYECPVEYDEAGDLVVSGECEALNGDPSCVLESSTCSTDNGTQLVDVECRQGAESVESSEECERERVHELKLQFVYECEFVLDEETGEFVPDAQCQAHIDDGTCTQGGQECSDLRPPDREDVSCVIGDEVVYDEEACSAKLQIIADEDYIWTVYKDWVAETESTGSFVNDADYAATEAAGCIFDSEVCVVPEPVDMRTLLCQVGFTIEGSEERCDIERDIVTDDDYVYSAIRTWNASLASHVPSGAWNILNTNCTLRNTVCSLVTEPTFKEYRCETGYRINTEQKVCDVVREVEVDIDYAYLGHSNWNADRGQFVLDPVRTAAIAENCTPGAEMCVVPSPGVFEEVSCERGYRIDYTNETVKRDVIVTTDDDYIYETIETWNGSTAQFEGNAVHNAVVAEPTNCERQSRVCTQQGSGVFSEYFCDQGYQDTFTISRCDVPRAITVDSDYLYQATRSFDRNSNVWVDSNELNALQSSSFCSKNGPDICVQDSPGVFEEKICQLGTRTDYFEKRDTRQRIVTVDEDYIYERLRTWNGSTHVKTAAWHAVDNDASCTLEGSVCTTATPPPFETYICESGYQDNETTPSCDRPREITVDLDYTYTVNREWSTSSNGWTGTGDWNAVRNASECTRLSQTCERTSPGVSTPFTCERGYRINDTNKSCDDIKSFAVNKTYKYTSSRNWNGSIMVPDYTNSQANNDPACTQTSGPVKTDPVTDLRANYSCLKGWVETGSSATCDVPLVVTVTARTGYKYSVVQREYYGSPSEPANEIDPLALTSSCTLIAKSTEQSPRYGLMTYSTYECTTIQTTQNWGPVIRQVGTYSWYSEADNWNTSACTAASNAGNLQSETCIEGGGTRTINGQSVTRSCWKRRRTYSSTFRSNVDTCNVPGGFTADGSTAYNPSWGTARSLSRYNYKRDFSLGSAENMIDYKECVGVSCLPPYGGTSLYQDVCAYTNSAGTCQQVWRSHSLPSNNPPDGYRKHTYVHTCSKAMTSHPSLNTPEVIRTRGADTWDRSACSNVASGFSEGCTQTSAGYVGSATNKTVDGLTISDRWTYRRNYTCGQRQDIDTCQGYANNSFGQKQRTQFASLSPSYDYNFGQGDAKIIKAVMKAGKGQTSPPIVLAAVGDGTFTGQTCLFYVGTVCTLWERNYDIEGTDPSGGCHEEQETWKCENPVSGAGSASISRHIATELFSMASCNAMVATHDSCTLKSEVQDTSTAGTRTINGLAVNRPFWSYKRTYDCTDRVTTETCSPPTGAVIHEVTCLWEDSGGTCRLARREYRRPLPDPSGGCTTYTDSFKCENQNHGTATRKVYEITSDSIPIPPDGPRSEGCVRTSYVWGPHETRNINGFDVRRRWTLEEIFECSTDVPVDTCSPLPAGAESIRNACVTVNRDSTCGVYEHTYRYPVNDPSGGCLSYREEYACTDIVPAAGDPVAIPKSIDSQTWNEQACQSFISNDNCELIEDTCTEGPETRTIDGLAVFQECWNTARRYECSDRTTTDTCSVPSGAVFDSFECLWTDRAGFCRLKRNRYLREEHDPSGGCDVFTNEFKCEEKVGSFPIKETVTEYVSASYDVAPYHAMRTAGGYDRCVYQPPVRCVEGAETRVINGVSVTRSCWSSEFDYECEKRTDYEGCDVVPGSNIAERNCLWTDRSGVCRAEALVISEPRPDPSGGCHSKQVRYLCENELGYGGPGSSIRGSDILGDSDWPDGVTSSGEPQLGGNPRYGDEASWVISEGPYGLSNVSTILTGQTIGDAEGGGGASENFDIDFDKSYEFSVYFKVSELDRHRVYFGLGPHVVELGHSGTDTNNPYFGYNYATSALGFETDKWYKYVGVVLPRGSSTASRGSYGGIFDTQTGQKIQNSTHFIWREEPALSYTYLRFFNFYREDQLGQYTHWYSPSIREISGSGVTIDGQDLDIASDMNLLGDETTVIMYDAVEEISSIESNELNTSECVTETQDSGTCTVSNSVCTEGPETRTINGLAVTQSCWAYQYTYDCDTRQSFDTCEPQVDATLRETNCLWEDAGGACRLVESVFDVKQPDPSGGCTEFTDSFLCEDTQSGVGSIIETITSVVSTEWNLAQCDAIDLGDRRCSFVETCVEPDETRIIDGLEVTLSCWKTERVYTCDERVPVDTCDVPADAVEISSDCALTDAGSCILFDKEYEWRHRDGSNGCHRYARNATCDTRDILTRNPDDYRYTYGQATLDLEQCDAIHANDTSCREVRRTCTDAAPNLRRPPIVVTASGDIYEPADPSRLADRSAACWEYEIVYECEDRTPIDTCTNADTEGCELPTETCEQTDRDGQCARISKVYSCDVDGTGGCVSQTTTFTCNVDTPVGSQDAFLKAPIVPKSRIDIMYADLRKVDMSYDWSLPEVLNNTNVIKASAVTDYPAIDTSEVIQFAQASNDNGFEPVDVIVTIERSYWDNSACTVWDNNAACELIGTNCTEPGEGVEPIRRAQDDFHQGYIGYAPGVEEECWNQQKVYQCGATSTLPACSNEASECTERESNCLITDVNGVCLISENVYECGAAQCGPSRRTCDERKGNPRFVGFKYSCAISSTENNSGGDQFFTTCTGFSGSCEQIVTREDVRLTFIDRELPSGSVDREITDDFTTITHIEKDIYCPTEQTGIHSSAVFEGYVSGEGEDAETANCTSIEAIEGCTLLSEACVNGLYTLNQDDIPGEASEVCNGDKRKIYQCEESAGGEVCSGSCTSWDDTYVCENAVDGGGTPTVVTNPDILARVDDAQCRALNDNDSCYISDEVCTEPGETRLVNGVPTFANCWKWERTYQCEEDTGFSTDCEVPDNCEFVRDECLAMSETGSCLTTEHIYQCEETTEVVLVQGEDGTCGPADPDDPYADPNEANEPEGASLFDVIAGLNSAREGSDDFQTEPSLFEGEGLKCGKLIFGAKNCCKEKGLLIGLGCNSEEEKLAVAREQDYCISVGSYCSKKAFFGTCLKKKETYCCFNSELARIVVETAMQQQGKTLGTPKEPNCSGFSVEQFQLLDLGRADFSSIADSMMDQMNLGDPEEIAARLRQRILEMQNGGGG